MKYYAPYGVSDPDASYINGDSRAGIQGSIPPAVAFEHPMRELVNLITNSTITPDQDDLEQVTKAIRSQRVNYAVDTGTANALAVAYDPPFVALTDGLPLRVLVAHANTGASTITVNNLGPYTIKRASGSALSANDLVAGEVVTLVYDGTNFQIVNFIGLTAETTNNNYYDVNIPYCNDSSASANTITAIFNPAITSLAAGDLILVKIANTNTGATSITVNANPSKTVKTSHLDALVANQIVVGQVAILVYDGTAFQLINSALASAVGGVSTQIAKRYIYQDTNYHTNSVNGSFAEAFRVTYAPVTVANKIVVKVAGSLSSMTGQTQDRSIQAYLAYSTDGGTTFNPASWPGADYPAVGTFAANPVMLTVGLSVSGLIVTFADCFNINGMLAVPAGPPASIIFRLMFAPAGKAPSAVLQGGTMLEITEYTL